MKFFMAEEIMPYWLQCCKCKKWREVTISNQKILEQDFIKDWNCSEVCFTVVSRDLILACFCENLILARN